MVAANLGKLIVTAVLAVSLAAGLSACGRKGPVEPPAQSEPYTR